MSGKVVTVANEKGGVGKTTTSVQLGFELAERGHLVCIVDNDPSGDATTALFGDDIPASIRLGNKPEGISNTIKMYAVDGEFEPTEITNNLFLMGATDALAMVGGADLQPAYEFNDSIDLLVEKFDYVIIDCPPSFGLPFTAAMFSSSSGGIVIPLVPEDLPFKAAVKVVNRINEANRRFNMNLVVLGVLANKVVNNPMSQETKFYLNEMQEKFGDRVFKTEIHQTVKISGAIALQEKVSKYARPGSKAALQIASFTDEVLERLES